MGLFGWLSRTTARDGDPRLGRWREAWRAAAERADGSRVPELARDLDALGLPEEEVEIEREMLDGLQQLAGLASAVDASGLPVVITGHRAVGADTCHLAAVASMPDEPGQAGGRLLLTSARAIFIGSGSATSVPWHAVAEVVREERDLLLVRSDRQRTWRFRCNVFADALCGAFLARRLAGLRRQRPPV